MKKRSSSWIILTFLRYLLAVFLAFMVSLLVVVLLLLPFPGLKNPMIALIGFVGVFLPSFVLPRQSRVVGAIFLLLFGIFYYCTCVIIYWEPLLPQIRKQMLPLLLLFAGGLIASGIHYFLARQKKHNCKP
jgi:hypothetical protein